MRVLVCGGRHYSNAAVLDAALDRVHVKHGITLLIEGGAAGADRLARRWAKRRGVPVRTCEAEWDKYGRAAGMIRNARMLAEERPEAAVAFPGGRGTEDMVARLRRGGVPVWIINDK